MRSETRNDNNSKKFEELLAKRRNLSKNNTNICKVSASDSQLKDTIKNFNESKQYEKILNLK